MTTWWNSRSQRERVLLGMMLLMALAVGLWLGVMRPLDQAKERARTDIGIAQARLTEIEGRAAMIRARGASAQMPAGATLQSLVQQIADGRGLEIGTPTASGNGLSVSIPTVSSSAFFGWVAELENSGIAVETLDVRKAGGDMLSADVRLRVANQSL